MGLITYEEQQIETLERQVRELWEDYDEYNDDDMDEYTSVLRAERKLLDEIDRLKRKAVAVLRRNGGGATIPHLLLKPAASRHNRDSEAAIAGGY